MPRLSEVLKDMEPANKTETEEYLKGMAARTGVDPKFVYAQGKLWRPKRKAESSTSTTKKDEKE